MCVRVWTGKAECVFAFFVCVCEGGGGGGWIQRDSFLIKRKYLCLHTLVAETWDISENSTVGGLITQSLEWIGIIPCFFAYMHF